MKSIKISIEALEYDTTEELSAEDKKLLDAAVNKLTHAYAPYSGFRVAAALLLSNGEIVCGTNQENAAYPSGLCAERVAMFAAASDFPGVSFKAIAITAASDKIQVGFPVTPCGACRQVMNEYAGLYNQKLKIILRGSSGKILVFNDICQLLPFSFNKDNLLNKNNVH